MSEYHIPVLVAEVIEGLKVQPGRWYVDATVGGGGHSMAILSAGGKVIGIDQDAEALAEAERVLAEPGKNEQYFHLIKGNFRDLTTLLLPFGYRISGILFDLGVSSHQFNTLERGFSFKSAQLDMRMDQQFGVGADQLVNTLSEADLATLLTDWGEEPMAKRFAKTIVTARRQKAILSGSQLAELLWQASPVSYRRGSIHPATRTFQALRIAVNDELASLGTALPQAINLLQPKGRLAVISFHSLEDRIVKHFFADNPDIMVVSKGPITAEQTEIEANPRARSAKLRIAEKR